MNKKNIKMFVVDVDGCLSSGHYIISDDGRITKSFCTRDFYGIEQLLKNNITVVILTQSHDEVIYEQIARICSHSEIWDECYVNGRLIVLSQIKNKKETVEKFLTNELDWSNIAYIGDAENDIECLKEVGFPACPNDAIEEVLEIDGIYVCIKEGGNGAVYEFCKWLLKKD